MVQVREGGVLTGEFSVIRTTGITGTGASGDSLIIMGVVPYRTWRIVAVGFEAVAGGASAVAEKVHFGIAASDIGASDDDYFGSLTQDATALKQIAAGDMLMNPSSHTRLRTPDDPANAGTHTWAAGSPDGIGVWQSKQAVVTVTKKQVVSSTMTIIGWALIEIGV